MEERIENSQNKLKWFMLFLMLAAFTVTFLARFIWSPMQATIGTDLGLNATELGLIFGAFYTGYVFTQVPAGLLADKFGTRVLMSLSLIIGGIATFMMSGIDSVQIATTYRIILGLGGGAIYACCARVITNYFKPEERSMAYGILLVGPNLGYFLASILGPVISSSYGWQGAFRIVGVIVVVVGILVFFLVKENQNKNASKQTLMDVLRGFAILFKNKGVLLISLAGFGLMWFQLAMFNWAFGYAKSLNIGAAIMIIGICISVGGMISSVLSGTIVDKFHIDRRKYMILGYLANIVAVYIFGAQTSLTGLYISAFVLGFITYSNNTHLTALVIDYSGSRSAATATGVSNFIYQIASQISPVVVGGMLVSSGGVFTTGIWTLMAAGPAVGIVLLLLAKNAPKAVD